LIKWVQTKARDNCGAALRTPVPLSTIRNDQSVCLLFAVAPAAEASNVTDDAFIAQRDDHVALAIITSAMSTTSKTVCRLGVLSTGGSVQRVT
jgi:hypothetical protein